MTKCTWLHSIIIPAYQNMFDQLIQIVHKQAAAKPLLLPTLISCSAKSRMSLPSPCLFELDSLHTSGY